MNCLIEYSMIYIKKGMIQIVQLVQGALPTNQPAATPRASKGAPAPPTSLGDNPKTQGGKRQAAPRRPNRASPPPSPAARQDPQPRIHPGSQAAHPPQEPHPRDKQPRHRTRPSTPASPLESSHTLSQLGHTHDEHGS